MDVARKSHRGWNAVLSGVLVAVVAASLVVLMRTNGGEGESQGESSSGGPVSVVGGGYPPEWTTTLDKAVMEARFQVPVPDTAEANESNSKEAYLSEDGTIFALVFKNPNDSAGVAAGEEDIEIYAEPYSLSVPPLSAWKSDAETIGKSASIRTVHGVDALVVESLAESDAGRDNPAFVRFVLDGVDISVHGGTEMGLILEIAESLKLQ